MAAGAILALSSCTLLFNPDELGAERDGGPEPPQADAEPLDPGEFGISGIIPNTIVEGEGTVWAVPVKVTGQEFTAADTTVVLNGAGFNQFTPPAVVAADGRSLAFPLTIPVRPDLDRGDSETIMVTVRKGALNATIQIGVSGLNELVTGQLADSELEASDLDPLYSQIIIDEDIVLTGDDPVRLVATAEIRLEAAVNANGEDGVLDDPDSGDPPKPGGVGGPGGCAGGARQQTGGCGIGGGVGNTRDDGAGGGGHALAGTPGGGVPTSPGGMETGRPDLVPLADESGNGGGGSSFATGGGGGGIVELTSHGTFVIDDGANVSADGGRGGPGRCDSSVIQGSGGGGSGGAILLRAWKGFEDLVNAPRLSLRGGSGGLMPPENDCTERGGAGAFGRVRLDTAIPSDELPGFADITPEPFQGPLFRNVGTGGQAVPVIVTQPQVTLEVAGQPETSFSVDVNGNLQTVSTSASGAGSVTATLRPGHNTICAKTSAGVALDVSEGVQCISIALIQ